MHGPFEKLMRANCTLIGNIVRATVLSYIDRGGNSVKTWKSRTRQCVERFDVEMHLTTQARVCVCKINTVWNATPGGLKIIVFRGIGGTVLLWLWHCFTAPHVQYCTLARFSR